MVYVSNTNSVTNSTIINNSNVNSCLLDVNYITTCTQQAWLSTQIKASNYMKRLPNGDKIIAVFNISMNWIDLSSLTPTSSNFKFTYLASNSSIHFLGYGIDSSGAIGCQDSATLTNNYPFGLGLGNTQCGDIITNTVFFSNPNTLGAFISGSWGLKEGIWIR